MNSQNLDAADPCHSRTIDGQRTIVQHHLFCVIHVNEDIVRPASQCQLTHLHPLCSPITISDESRYCSVTYILDFVCGMGGSAVMRE